MKRRMARTADLEPQQDLALGSRLVVGAVAGFVATLAITSAIRRLRTKRSAPTRNLMTPRRLTATPSHRSRASPDLMLVAHFAYGAGCGAVMAALSPRIGRAGGALAGATVWLTAHMGWLPALGAVGPAPNRGLRQEAASLAAHISWGVSTAQAIRELSAARTTIFTEL